MAATVIPSVGCPVGCNFCSTSAMFGGKGRSVRFYETGDELFDIMCQLEANLKVQSFFMMDENFLLDRVRALRLLELMERHDKAWALYLFSSASAVRSYRTEQLVRLGLTWVWLGLEGEDSQLREIHGADTRALVRRLQAHGTQRCSARRSSGWRTIRRKTSTAAIEHAVSHDTDFHQFMLYTPLPGTPLHAELSAQGRMKDESECELADIHGQSLFNYRHPHIRDGLETELIVRAFHRDFEVNGPSVVRMARTMLAGWKRYKNHPDSRVRRRFAWEARDLSTVYPAMVAAARRYYRGNPTLRAKMDAVLKDLHGEFGLKSRLYAAVGGRYVYWKMRREESAARERLDLRTADLLRAECSGPSIGLRRRPAGDALPSFVMPLCSSAGCRGCRGKPARSAGDRVILAAPRATPATSRRQSTLGLPVLIANVEGSSPRLTPLP